MVFPFKGSNWAAEKKADVYFVLECRILWSEQWIYPSPTKPKNTLYKYDSDIAGTKNNMPTTDRNKRAGARCTKEIRLQR